MNISTFIKNSKKFPKILNSPAVAKLKGLLFNVPRKFRK